MGSESGELDRCGQWVVTTDESEYTLDIGHGLVRRRPVTGDHLRADGDWVPLLAVFDLEVGRPMVLLLDVRGDGRPTFRFSTRVVRIQRRCQQESVRDSTP